MKMKKMACVCLMLGLWGGLEARAARNAKVIVESAAVLDQPQPTAVVVGNVPKDTTIPVSNLPTNGYYKSRIPNGTVGWISGNDILAVKAAEKPPSFPKMDKEKKAKKDDAPVSDHSRILISGGLQFLSNSGFPSQISVTNSKRGYGGTLEMQFKINDRFYWAGRAEYLTSSSSQTTLSGSAQTFKFRAIPLMVGVVFVPVSKSSFRVGIGGYAGVSLLTSLDIAQASALVNSSVSYSSSDLTFYGNLQGSYAITSVISVLGEVGYRIQSASYPESTELPADAFKANYGGLVTRLGFEFRL